MRIGIIAALPGELKPLVKRWQKVPVNKESGVAMWRTTRGADELIAACAGMGAAAAGRAFAAAEFSGSLDLVLSVGWAGALTNLEGISLVISEIIDAQTGERFRLTDGKRRLRVVTTAQVADVAEKHRLQATYGAAAVDMEAATVARLAQMRGIPMCCFKVISDAVDAKLPDVNVFVDADGQLRLAALLAHVAVRPWFWKSMVSLGRRSSLAANELAVLMEQFLVHKDVERVNRTGGVE